MLGSWPSWLYISVLGAPSAPSFLSSLPLTSLSTGKPSEEPTELLHFEALPRNQEWGLREKSHQEPGPVQQPQIQPVLLSVLTQTSLHCKLGPRGQGGRVESTQHLIQADWNSSSALIVPFLRALEEATVPESLFPT